MSFEEMALAVLPNFPYSKRCSNTDFARGSPKVKPTPIKIMIAVICM
jgi:hypothetical protein